MKPYMIALVAVCFSFSLSAQSKSEIEKAERLMDEGFPKDAAVALQREIAAMSCGKDVALYVKANILYISALSQYEEDAIVLSINHLNEMLPKCQAPATQVFHSYLGELYMQYGGFGGAGTKKLESPDDDISTWSAAQIEAKALQHFRASLQEPQLLFSTPISDYAMLLMAGKYDEKYRPTLYDLIAHRFFDNCREQPSRAEYPALNGTLPEFLQMKTDDDATSMKTFAITTWQQLLRLHESDQDPTALIQNELDRIVSFATDDTGTAAYDYLLQTYDAHPAVTLAAFRKAQQLNVKGMTINMRTAGVADKRSRVEAAEICRKYAKKFPGSDGGENCAKLLKEIEKQELTTLNTESILIPSKSALANVSFRNLQRLTCMVYAVPSDKVDLAYGRNRESDAKKFLSDHRPMKQWEIEIPDLQDFLTHSTEFEIPPIGQSGFYLLLVTPDPVFSIEKSVFVTQVFQVSSLCPFYTQTTGKNASFTVTDRLTGVPLKGVSIVISNTNNSKTVLETLKTDDNGIASLSKDYNTGLSAVFAYKNDTLSLQQSIWNTKQSSSERKNYVSASLFTDRGVYRPGQTVYFKGILTEISEKDVTPVANEKVEISVRDVNYQEVLTMSYVSDDMGGFDGVFTIPANVLTGTMVIQAKPNGATSFLVEEYKRPRFEVTFDKISEAYKLNEEVKITGKAMMLNGLPLENAKVDFQISRQIFRPLYYGYYLPRFSPDQIIATGTTTTKADGTFEVTFKTVADPTEDGSRFHYIFKVTADVTDITGEMQSGSATISAGRKGLIINTEVPNVVIGKENDELQLSFKNYSGETVPTSATLVIEELSQPKTAYISRSWAIPDIFIISKEDFTKKFPQYAYDSDSLPVAKQVYSTTIANKATETLKLSEKLTRSGQYRITVSTSDKTDEPITDVTEFTFLKENEKTFPIVQNALFHIDKKSVASGEKVKIFAGSAAKDAKVFYTLVTPVGVQKQQWMDVGKQPLSIEIQTDAMMIPSFTVNLYLVQNNRIYEKSEQISVTDPTKELKVEVTGIRDKTMPGAKERWQMKITDKDGKPVTAALFTSMYDAALDKFAPSSWSFTAAPNYRRASYSSTSLTRYAAFSNNRYNEIWSDANFTMPVFPAFDWFGFRFYSSRFGGRYMNEMSDMGMKHSPMSAPSAKGEAMTMAMDMAVDEEMVMERVETAGEVAPESTTPDNARQNFAETVFFYPDMRTDSDGNIILEFVMPESLTKWNMQAIGYTNTLQIGQFKQSIVTESDFMVMPNLPRYLRVGDDCVLTSRIANRTDKPLSGTAKIVIENMATGVSLQENIIDKVEIPFTVNGNESITVSWKYRQADNADALLIRITATSGSFTDGEEHILPVLPSEVVLQETIAMEMTTAGTYSFSFNNFGNAPQKLTVDLSTSPVWFAIQSLPTLAEYPHESADQIFNRYYAAALGSHILNSMPQIKRVFDQWRNLEPDALLSNLEKNQDLKAMLLAETPWVMEAQNETARKQRLSTLFDLNNLTYSLRQAASKLQQRQLPDGGFSWYPDMKSSVYITRYIVTGIGKLNALKINNSELNYIAERAIQYLDKEWMTQYEKITEKGKYGASSYDIAYLYCRSFFMDKKFEDKQNQVLETVIKECIQKQKDFDFDTRAMLALTLQRRGKTADAQTIAKSLDNYSIGNASTGKYWRTQQGGGNASDIALSALMVEVYNEILNDKTASNDVLTWLLRNKRTNDWQTPVATADAVYALVSASPTSLEPAQVTLKVGAETITPETQEAGTGYFQVVYNKNDIKPEMKTITAVSSQDKQVWGGAYLQYRSPIDKVKGDKNAPLSVDRELFKRNGDQWERITDNAPLKVGDKVTVRLTVKANRDFDFVHVRDMRAATFEPVEQTSGYARNHQIGYYRSVRDAVVNLFIDHLPRGTWTLEYELFVTQSGNFSNGYASIQCFYAPEFSGVSDGGTVRVE